jgi:hypothetical protein
MFFCGDAGYKRRVTDVGVIGRAAQSQGFFFCGRVGVSVNDDGTDVLSDRKLYERDEFLQGS